MSNKAPTFHQRRIIKRTFTKNGLFHDNPTEIGKKLLSHRKRQTIMAESEFYIKDRNYAETNSFYEHILGKSILSLAKELSGKRKRLRILDDGAGEGVFVSELHKHLNSEGISPEIHATSLFPNDNLQTLKDKGKIKSLQIGFAELSVPKEQFDLIFSTYGSLNYTINELLKEHFLKNVSSLKKRGVLLATLVFKSSPSSVYSLDSPTGKPFSLSRKSKDKVKQNTSNKKFYSDIEGIKKALSKRGYNLIYQVQNNPPSIKVVLAVQKLR